MQALNLAQRVLGGDRLALAKAITLVESSLPKHRDEATLLMNELQLKDNTLRVGICGTPGAGKSTLINRLGMHILSSGVKPAVLAMDPSSVNYGGSILGDKTRMIDLSMQLDAYVRPSPTRGMLGGITSSCSEAILLCEAAGFSSVIVETVGLGQSETLIDDISDIVVLVTSPAEGDSLQGIKKGIMEVADIIAVNKCDGPLESKAKRAKMELMKAISFNIRRYNNWTPEVVLVSALSNLFIPELWETVLRARDELKEKIIEKRRRQAMKQTELILNYLLREQLKSMRESSEYTSIKAALDAGQLVPRKAAYDLVRVMGSKIVSS
jgi:LAO/AO transport system kinase